MKIQTSAVEDKRKVLPKGKGLFYLYIKHKYLVLLFMPALIYYVVFHYAPLYGLQLAFKEYNFMGGIWGSKWIGFEIFKELFALNSFWEVFRNTLIISFYKLIFGFPAPVILAILLNEVRLVIFKRFFQTISYMPHFLSWVVVAGLFTQLLSPSIGPINIILKTLGFDPIFFMADPFWFRTVLVVTEIWKEIGWGTIIYLAALTGINPELYEASRVDGANRFQNIIYITLPSMTPVITIMFIFAVGKLVNDDFDQVFNMYNPAVYSVGDVLSTYTYRRGLLELDYGFATAVGLFKNLIAFVLIITTNAIARRLNDYALW